MPLIPTRPMNHEESVLDRYPQAKAIHIAPIFQHGQPSAFCQDEWIILDEPNDRELGMGPTEQAAWEDASSRIGPPAEKAA